MGYEALISYSLSLIFAVVLGNVLSNGLAVYYKYNREYIESGLYGFNGILTAMSVVLYIQNNIVMWFILVIGVLLSTIVTRAFKNLLTDSFSIPGSTGPFVFCSWLIIFAAYQFSSVTVNTGIYPHFITDYTGSAHKIIHFTDYIGLFFKNIGQVYFLSSPISGVIILIGIFFAHRKFACYAMLGSIVTIIIGEILGVDKNILFNGLYGYSPVLTAIALGCVFIKKSLIYTLLGIVITVFLQASLYSITASFAVPTFTSAFLLCLYLLVAAYNIRKN
ncbi:urea transporter [Photobacterium leiognathi]|uniref:urea transporter n=1 Tax=Photobacterium leiognathi TaxID=553611 RepID=UPI0009BE83D6|nr:urea transporter [Photobacterium leiognathi]